jgi:hypothetical protein
MTDYEEVALRFTKALSVGDFNSAHALLDEPGRARYSGPDLQHHFETMIAQGAGQELKVEIMESLEHWPAKQAHDLGWVYVSVSGQSFAEAVAVIVSHEAGALRIRELEWGRP